jgi:hypothetical protein
MPAAKAVTNSALTVSGMIMDPPNEITVTGCFLAFFSAIFHEDTTLDRAWGGGV